MLLEANGGAAVAQCEIASLLWPNCCPDDPCDGSGACNHELDDPAITALLLVECLGKVCYEPRPLDSDEVKAEIDAGRPVQAGFSYGEDGGHLVLVTGYQDTGTGRQFTVLDPGGWSAAAWPYLGLKCANGLGKWDATWILTVR